MPLSHPTRDLPFNRATAISGDVLTAGPVIPDDRWDELVQAIMVRKPEAGLAAGKLIAFCRTLLGGFKCPRGIEFRDTLLPWSGAGRVFNRNLRAPFWENRIRNVN